MGIVVVDEFLTLDGVFQAPGGREEDPSDGFAYGGWQAPFLDEESGEAIGAGIERIDALLLGRRTYEIFAGYWPHQEGPIARKLNAVPKLLASRTVTDPTWEHTTVLSDVASDVRDQTASFDEIHVIGSGALVQTLLAEDLVDRLNLWLYPVTLGSGKRFFDGGTIPATFRLAQPPRGFPGGGVSLVYERAGEVVTGDIGEQSREEG